MSLLAQKCVSGSIRSVFGAQIRHGTSIPVIFVQKVENRGEIGEVVEVKRGFARNYLIPRKLAGMF